MGYYMHQTGGKFIIRRSQIEQALEALRQADKQPASQTGTPTDQLGDLFGNWSWRLDLDEQTGDIVDVQFEGEKYVDDDELFRTVAPFVEAGSFITMMGQDDESWRWYFDGQEMITQPGNIVYEDSKVIVEVRGGVAEVTQCPAGIEVEIIDHDNRDAEAEEARHADRAA